MIVSLKRRIILKMILPGNRNCFSSAAFPPIHIFTRQPSILNSDWFQTWTLKLLVTHVQISYEQAIKNVQKHVQRDAWWKYPDSNSEMQIYSSFDVQNVKEGEMQAMKSHLQRSLNLMITRCPTLVQTRRGTIQKPLCHTQLAFAILTTRHGASPETHSVSWVHKASYKEPL